MEFTQVLLSESFEEVNSTNEKLPVATLEIDGVYYTIYNSENTIGRDDSCNIIINRNVISSKHAVIEAEDPNAHLVYDLGSTNKTKLGKITLKPHVRYHINDGDVVTFGNVSALYNVSRQLPNSPAKVKPMRESVPETPEKDEGFDNIVSDSSSEEKRKNVSVLDTSDVDMFDEVPCDTSAIQLKVVGSTAEGESKKDDNIYEMDTLNFDSDIIPADESHLKKSGVSSGKPCNSFNDEFVDDEKNFSNCVIPDSQNDNESIYDICTQRSNINDDLLEVCDSTMKGTDNDKHNMEVTSSVAEDDENKQLNENDLSVYEIHTQNPLVDNAQLNDKSDSLFEKGKSNNFEWEDFPDIASPLGLDTSNADNLDCPDTNKPEENYPAVAGSSELKPHASDEMGDSECLIRKSKQDNDESSSYKFHEAGNESFLEDEHVVYKHSLDHEKLNTTISNKLDNNREPTMGPDQELDLEDNNLLPASQNIDMFETSPIKKDTFGKNETCVNAITNFNESDDESMYHLANQLFPDKRVMSNKSSQNIDKGSTTNFLFEAATQPVELEEVTKDSTRVTKVDETLSSTLFEANTQPTDLEKIKKGSTATINVDDTFPSLLFEADTEPTKLEEVTKDSTRVTQIEETLTSALFVAATQPAELGEVTEDCITAIKVNETLSSTLFETDTEPVELEEVTKDSTTAIKVDETLTSALFEAAAQPAKLGEVTKGCITAIKVDETLSSTLFETDTEPVELEEVTKDSTTAIKVDEILTSALIEATHQAELGEVTKDCITAIKVDETLSSTLFETDTEPTELEEVTKDSTTAITVDETLSSSFLKGVAQQIKAQEGSASVSKGDEALSSSFFEVATQPVVENKNLNLRKDKTLKPIEKVSPSLVTESSVQNEKIPLKESFYEVATQPVGFDLRESKQIKNPENKQKIFFESDETSFDIPSEILNFVDSGKQFCEDLILTQGFYEAATQPYLESDSGVEGSKATTSEGVSPLHSHKPRLNKDVPATASKGQSLKADGNFHELAAQSLLNNNDVFQPHADPDSTIKAKQSVKKDIRSSQNNKNTIPSCASSNVVENTDCFTESFFQMATQPAPDDEIEESESLNVASATEKSVDPLSTAPDAGLSTPNENFYEALTQPCPESNFEENVNPPESISKISENATVCKEVLMELSESIFHSAGNKCSKNETLDKPTETRKLNYTTSNKTIKDHINMSLSCVNLGEILTQEAIRDDSQDSTEKFSSNCIVNNAGVDIDPCIIEVGKDNTLNCNSSDKSPDKMKDIFECETTSDLAEPCEKNSDIAEVKISKENSEQNLVEAQEVIDISDKTKDDSGNEHISDHLLNEEKTDSEKRVTFCLKKKSSAVVNERSQDSSPVIVTRRSNRRLIISDSSEQSSEEFAVKFKRKGCNVFPPDTQESISPSRNSSTDSEPIDKSQKKNRKDATNKSKIHSSQTSENKSSNDENQLSSEESVIKFKKKNINVFPPDSEPIISNDIEYDPSRQTGDSSVSHLNIGCSKSQSFLGKSEKEISPKKNKSPHERDHVYVSRGNVTFHTQKVLEELEETFRLVADAMSPTQLSVVSDSSDEILPNRPDSPVIRRSERKRSEKIVYKPLTINAEEEKVSKIITSKDQRKTRSRVNLTPQQPPKDDKPHEDKLNSSFKKFKKATPKDHSLKLSKEGTSEHSNVSKDDALEKIKKESFDTYDSQNSMSNFENSESEELGRGKRKRTKTSFDDFVLEEDFKNLQKKSASPTLPLESSIVKCDSQDTKSEKPSSIKTNSFDYSNLSQKLCVVLHDISKNPPSSISKGVLKSGKLATGQNKSFLENDEDDLIFPAIKPSVSKLAVKKKSNTTNSEDKNKIQNESSSKSNGPSFSEKLDELFNIWGPADRVKLSPRAPKKTYKVLENEGKVNSNQKSKQSTSPVSSNSSKPKSKSKADLEKVKSKSVSCSVGSKSRKNGTKPASRASAPASQELSISKSLPSRSRRLLVKHKVNDEGSINEPAQKKLRKSSSQTESLNSSPGSEVPPAETKRSTRSTSNTNSVPNSDSKINGKRSANNNTSRSDDDQVSPVDNSKKKRFARSMSRSQETANRTSKLSNPQSGASNDSFNSNRTVTAKNLSKRINRQVSSKNNIKNHKQSHTSPSQSNFPDDHYIMSQEFSFRERNSIDKTPLKEEFKPPQLKVRRSARSKNSEKKTEKKEPQKILFTGLPDRKFSALVTKLGGEVVDSPFTCTVLITDKVRRTAKFLSVLSRGIPIVTPEWLTSSSGDFTDVERFIVNDKEAEASYSFTLKNSIQKARAGRVLDGWSVYVTPSVNPPTEDMKSIIECSGGKFLQKEPTRWPPNSLVISCEEDKKKWDSLTKRGKRPPIVGTEALFSGILQQNLKIEDYRLI